MKFARKMDNGVAFRIRFSEFINNRYIDISFEFNGGIDIAVIYDTETKNYGFWWIIEDDDEIFTEFDVIFKFRNDIGDIIAGLGLNCKGESTYYDKYKAEVAPWISSHKDELDDMAVKHVVDNLL